MKVTVIGAGRWGSFIAWYLNSIGFDTLLYGRENSTSLKKAKEENPNIKTSNNLKVALENDIIVISVASQSLRDLMLNIKEYSPKNKTFVLCMKGIEIISEKRLSQVAQEHLSHDNKVAVWLGPGHVQEFKAGIPNCMVIDSDDDEVKEKLISMFSSNLIRFYYGCDLIGNEIGAAAKNVIGIAAGMVDGLKLSSLKGALMSRGTREIARLIRELGGHEQSAYGLCHLGDYEATVFSKHSQNRLFGEKFIKGEPYEKLAEGYYTVKALVSIGKKVNVDLPICDAVYSVLYENRNPKDGLEILFSRSLKEEFY